MRGRGREHAGKGGGRRGRGVRRGEWEAVEEPRGVAEDAVSPTCEWVEHVFLYPSCDGHPKCAVRWRLPVTLLRTP